MTSPDDQPNPWSRQGQANEGFAEPVSLPQPKPGTPPVYPQPPVAYPPPPPPYLPPPPPKRRTGLWVTLGVLAAVLTGLAMWAVVADDRARPASSSPAPAQNPGDTKVVTAKDQKSQITVPATWKDVPPSFKNEFATLQLGDESKAEFILIVSGAPADFDNFQAFTQTCVDEARELALDAEVSEARPLTVGGLNAVQHEVSGKVRGFKIVYWFTMIEGKRGYYEVVGWTQPSKKDEAGPRIRQAIESFRELAG